MQTYLCMCVCVLHVYLHRILLSQLKVQHKHFKKICFVRISYFLYICMLQYKLVSEERFQPIIYRSVCMDVQV